MKNRDVRMKLLTAVVGAVTVLWIISPLFGLEKKEQPEDMEKGFSVTDDGVADWSVRKIAEERENPERLKALA